MKPIFAAVAITLMLGTCAARAGQVGELTAGQILPAGSWIFLVPPIEQHADGTQFVVASAPYTEWKLKQTYSGAHAANNCQGDRTYEIDHAKGAIGEPTGNDLIDRPLQLARFQAEKAVCLESDGKSELFRMPDKFKQAPIEAEYVR